ncbi:hypothetical protein ScPMuIL_005055 [Solemya velum]
MNHVQSIATLAPDCDPGTYSINDNGILPCEECPANTYNPNTGAGSCLQCAETKISSPGSSSVDDCKDPCDVNTCQGHEVCTNCLSSDTCSVGAPDYSICTCPCTWGGPACDTPRCPKGQHSETGSTQCEDCPAGSYQDQCGQVECTPCPEGKTSYSGSESIDDCFTCTSRFGEGWVVLDVASTPNCYFVVKKKKTFSKAETHCGNKNAALVKIDNAEENAAIFGAVSMNKKNTWIGMHVDHSVDPPMTSTLDSPGEQAPYTNFPEGEPNNHNDRAENCVQMRKPSGLWNDQRCGKSLYSVCEIEID